MEHALRIIGLTRVMNRCLIAAILLSATHAMAELENFGLSPSQIERVKKGELIVTRFEPPNDAGVSFQAVQRLNIHPRKLRPVLRDCQYFSEFMPHTLKSTMRDKSRKYSGVRYRCRYAISLR